MKGLFDLYPLDWENHTEYNELLDILINMAEHSGGIKFLKGIANASGIASGKFPERGNLRNTIIALIEEMGLQGRLRRLVEEASKIETRYKTRLSELFKLPAPVSTQTVDSSDNRLRKILSQSYLFDKSVLFLDRIELRKKLQLLVPETNPMTVLLVRGGSNSGKTYGRYLFEWAATKLGAQYLYLFDGLVSNVNDLVLQLFVAFEASDEIPPRNTTENAWYKLVCAKLQEIASSKKQALWIAIDDLGLDEKEVPLLDQDIRNFCNQFALNMMNPLFRKWFRIMLIDYPEGPVPTKWTSEIWTEDRTSSRPKKIKSVTVSIVSPFICHEVMGLDAMIFIF